MTEREARSQNETRNSELAAKYAWKFIEAGDGAAPTDENMAQVFARCVRPAPADLYPAIRERVIDELETRATYTADVYGGEISMRDVDQDPANANMVFGVVVDDTRGELPAGSRVWIAAAQVEPVYPDCFEGNLGANIAGGRV